MKIIKELKEKYSLMASKINLFVGKFKLIALHWETKDIDKQFRFKSFAISIGSANLEIDRGRNDERTFVNF